MWVCLTCRLACFVNPQVCAALAAACKAPLILPLTGESPECTALDAYNWTEGRCLLATGDERPLPLTLPNGRQHTPSQAAPPYIFPGV
jgi:malic enzyme